MKYLSIKLSTLFILVLSLIQCKAEIPDPETIENRNLAEIKEMLQSANNVGNNVSFVAAAAISTPCVVHIKTKVTVVQNFHNPFQDFFGNDFGFFSQPRSQNQEASGSGVIISADGFIITNNHVIQNSKEIEVTLRNKNTYKAKVIGTDKDSDLALLKIEETNLPAIQIANSDSVLVGEWVLAVGNPFNLESTVTQGIVSAKGRSLNLEREQGATPIESFIQTDAAINPGNSGGALVNLNGELIGINTAIASPTGAYAGYAFAVPSNLVKKVIDDLKRFGNVQRAFMGINLGNLTSDKAKDLSLPSPNGVLIADVTKGGSAEQAGLKKEDVIVNINGVNIASVPELLEQISTHRPGDKIKVDYYRNGKLESIQLTLKNRNNNTEVIRIDDKIFQRTGIEVTPLTSQELMKYRVQSGAKVTKIKEGLIKQATELKEGFIITAVGDTPVGNEEEIKKALQKIEKGTVVIEGFYPNRPYTYQYAFKI